MSPNRENFQKPSRLSMETLQKTISDISLELAEDSVQPDHLKLPPISEVEDANCECCGMCEECTPEYISRVRDKFSGKLICGLCAEAVKEEMDKDGGKRLEEALSEHMGACSRFNRFDRRNPVLFQAEAMKEILKKSSSRAKSLSPVSKRNGITRSSSCIPAIARDQIIDREVVN